MEFASNHQCNVFHLCLHIVLVDLLCKKGEKKQRINVYSIERKKEITKSCFSCLLILSEWYMTHCVYI